MVSIFRSIAAPRRLVRIIEGKACSTMAAIALFGVFMSYVMLNVPDPTVSDAPGALPGADHRRGAHRLGRGRASRCGSWRCSHATITPLISVSVALPYLAYIGAEQTVGASGVIAVVTAGLTLCWPAPAACHRCHGRICAETGIAGALGRSAGSSSSPLLIRRLLESVEIGDMG